MNESVLPTLNVSYRKPMTSKRMEQEGSQSMLDNKVSMVDSLGAMFRPLAHVAVLGRREESCL